jgi:cytochrome c oxidase subunit 2
VLAAAAVLAGGCGGDQSTVRPAGKAADEIAGLWWTMMVGGWLVLALVVMLLAVALLRRRTGRTGPDAPEPRHGTALVLTGGVALPLVVLTGLFWLMLQVLPDTSAAGKRTALTVDVTGHQWWWEVRYPGTGAVTANEIHIPAGRAVRVRVRTADVIHSLWVPRLNRKLDMIPGKDNELVLEADRPGVYRGQCAEFCGLQHANMAFFVVADPPARFRAWLDGMAAPATAPAGASERRGLRVFLGEGCGGCHTIRGTDADGRLGPDLTHLAARSTLAAGTIPNSTGDLAGWILDPQHAKPGNKMPGFDLRGSELQDLVAYLRSLTAAR